MDVADALDPSGIDEGPDRTAERAGTGETEVVDGLLRRTHPGAGGHFAGFVEVHVERLPADPPEQLDRIFEPFYRVGNALTEGKSGAGIGLTIARELARGPGGRKRIYILDEPTIGLHMVDVDKLLRVLDKLLERGIYVIGFSFPVVPRGEARIRTQMSAAHTREHLDRAIDAFVSVGKELEIIS